MSPKTRRATRATSRKAGDDTARQQKEATAAAGGERRAWTGIIGLELWPTIIAKI
jgi:hypothetical protein